MNLNITPRLLNTLLVLPLVILASNLSAEDIRNRLFERTTIDFGTVARGAKTVRSIKIKNPYNKPLKILSVRSSCGCTTPTVPKKVIPANGEGRIIAEYNTRSFLGHKQATLTVVFGAPIHTEVQLTVKGYIRSDVVFDPGVIDFKNVTVGSPKTVKTVIDYAGSPDWKIVDIRSTCRNLSARLKEIQRSGSSVKYELETTIFGDLNKGMMKGVVLVVTNENTKSQVPLSFSAKVESPLTVSPANLELGEIIQGEVLKKRFFLKAKKPFKILSADTGDQMVKVKAPEKAKRIHMVEVTISADKPTKLKTIPIKFTTDLGADLKTEAKIQLKVVD